MKFGQIGPYKKIVVLSLGDSLRYFKIEFEQQIDIFNNLQLVG